ncbi:hypothetical protein Scep_022007 [Stephania cephalantha]|uniref:Uncharacterized protein n=1 Tax=Stephania cephalantha TaxID=152367 RepID=A0AAP0HXB7_9MAGN
MYSEDFHVIKFYSFKHMSNHGNQGFKKNIKEIKWQSHYFDYRFKFYFLKNTRAHTHTSLEAPPPI